MRFSRPVQTTRLGVLAIIALLVVGCSGPNPNAAYDEVYQEARGLGEALGDAIAATRDVNAGLAEPISAARRIQRASAASNDFARLSATAESTELRDISNELIEIADRTVLALTMEDAIEAERIRATEFFPVASRVLDLRQPATASERTANPSLVAWLPIVAVIVSAVLVGFVRNSIRNRKARKPQESEAGASWYKFYGGSAPWDSPNPDADPDPSLLDENGQELYRPTRVRTMPVELQDLLERTLDQLGERGWDVTLSCPEVHIEVDPLRLQRAVLTTIANAYLDGADRVDIAVEVVEDEVALSISHDAPTDEAAADSVAARLAGQLQPAFGEPDLAWSTALEEHTSRITVELGAAIDSPTVNGGFLKYLRRGTTPTSNGSEPDHGPWYKLGLGGTSDHPDPQIVLTPSDRSAGPGSLRHLEPHRPTNVRTMPVELRLLLELTLEELTGRGWQVILICPDVTVTVDPLRLQQAILAAIAKAHIRGASRSDLVVTVDDDEIVFSIGHDAPRDEAATESNAARLATQLEFAFATSDLSWSTAHEHQTSHITVELGTAPDAPQRSRSPKPRPARTEPERTGALPVRT